MREREARQLRSQSVFGPTRRNLESCPRSVADSWRRWSGRNHEIAQTLSTLFSFPGFPAPQPATRDIWRFPRSAGHLGPAKKSGGVLGVEDAVPHLLRPYDAPGARYRCSGVAHLSGI